MAREVFPHIGLSLKVAPFKLFLVSNLSMNSATCNVQMFLWKMTM